MGQSHNTCRNCFQKQITNLIYINEPIGSFHLIQIDFPMKHGASCGLVWKYSTVESGGKSM
jgi:hypothetical protein